MSLQIVHDIETRALTPDATILTVGAALVETDTDEIKDQFYQRAEIVQVGRAIDQECEEWWGKQSFGAFSEAFGYERLPLLTVLAGYNDWINKYENSGIYGNGSDFDNVILAHAFGQHNLEWPYWRNCCLRSKRNEVGGKRMPYPSDLIKHIAINDAIHEAAELTDLLRRQWNKPPAGWRLAPLEPSEFMYAPFVDDMGAEEFCDKYRTMLDEVPEYKGART